MSFHLLLLLMLTERSECLTVGREIIAAFPENIASYHPSLPSNQLHVIGLHDATTVTISSTFTLADGTTYSDSGQVHSGEILEFPVNETLELDKNSPSMKVVTITGDKDIAVQLFSFRSESIQTALLFATDQLGMTYQLLPMPLTGQASTVAAGTTGRPFKLIIVNNMDMNTISVEGSDSFDIQPGNVMQISINQEMVGKLVTGTKPFLALFSQSCAIQYDCTCGVLYTPLRPHNTDMERFIVPSVFSDEAQTQTYLLKPSVHEPQQFTEGSFEVSGQLVLHRPGLLLNLIPEAEFGSCFAVHTVSIAVKNWAVIVAPAASTGDVQIGNSPLEGVWNPVSGTDFKYTKVQLDSMNNIIWHKSGLMAVWFLGQKNENRNTWFGNPAARLSKYPDHRGCALEPERLEVLEEEVSWQKALEACKNRGLALISFPDETLQNDVYNRILNQNLEEVWMGLRMSSYSGKWYWISMAFLKYVDWSEGSPGERYQEKCGRISLKNPEDPGWVHRDCCSLAKAVCYQPPTLLRI